MSFRELLLREGTIPGPVQVRLAAEYPQLANNKNLTDEAVDVLLQTPLGPDEAAVLYQRQLTDAQRDAVLKKERRTGPLAKFVTAHWDNCNDTQKAKLQKLAKGAVADDLLYRDGVDADALLVKCSGRVRMTALATLPPDRLSDQIVAESLCDVTWMPSGAYGLRAWASKAVCAGRPHLMDTLLVDTRTIDSFVTAAAGSLHLDAERQRKLLARPHPLSGWTYRALVANPRVTDETLAEVLRRCEANQVKGDGDMRPVDVQMAAEKGPKFRLVDLNCDDTVSLAAAVKRALPDRYSATGRPFDLLTLSECPNLGPLAADVITELATFCDVLDAQQGIPAWQYHAAFVRLGAAPPTATPRTDAGYRLADPPTIPPVELNTLVPDRFRNLYPASRAAALAETCELLGDHPDVWRFVLETGDRFTNPVTQLIVLAKASIGVA